MNEGSGLDPLLAQGRRLDPDRTLCVLFAPAARRAELLALVLLNQELARVAETVRQPLAGAIRLRFWRDQLAAAASGAACDHALARILAEPLREGRLPLPELEVLIDARESELEGLLEENWVPTGPRPSMAALEAHVRATSGGLARAMARLLGAPDAIVTAAEAAGTAYGLVGLVRAAPFEAARARRIRVRSLLDAAGLDPGGPRRTEDRDRLCALARSLLGRAEAAIRYVRAEGGPTDGACLAPFLLATVAEVQLRALQRVGCDPYRLPARPGAALLPLRLLYAWLRRRA